MPKRSDIESVLVVGSGPIIIGQAAEFDYAGTQACQALQEEGLRVILINSNPATIMTDTDIADRVYIEPLTADLAEEVIARERPDGMLATLGGQVGLNLATELMEKGILERYGVELLGTSIEAITRAEDRLHFKQTMQQLEQPIPESSTVESVEAALELADELGLPLVVRPAYTLGGTGGGIAETREELREIAGRGLKSSRIGQVLVERSVAGWKEVEYEVMRDSRNNCISVCNMENIDPVGVHTGDSIVVAPSQTLTDYDYHRLRSAALSIIRALEIEGGCNIQFALDPASSRFCIIEVNPRVSRSSALASKATGYPIAKVAAKIAVGLNLDEIRNPVTGNTLAAFEPALDYVVVKIPRWPFEKFATAERQLGTQMKATGEVMAIERSFEAALLKAVRSLDGAVDSFGNSDYEGLDESELERRLETVDDERLFLLAEALERGFGVEKLNDLTGIDPFFLNKFHNVVKLERQLVADELAPDLLRRAKQQGIGDKRAARLTGSTEQELRELRKKWDIIPVYKMVDTCAGEFDAATPYYYSTYEQEDEVERGTDQPVVVLGSGPIRIGQGIEFDYCSVHAVWALRELGLETVIVNNNPETVSTDFDTADRLYFEPLVLEEVLNVIEAEQASGVVVQFGGQTALQLASVLEGAGVPVLGTGVEAIDVTEDRARFMDLLEKLDIPYPRGEMVTSLEGAATAAEKLGFPVLVRPSYVLGGRAMTIVSSEAELIHYLQTAVDVSSAHPVLVDEYLPGVELEVDAVADGSTAVIPAVMEHVERAGVHSGDSVAFCPTQHVSPEVTAGVVEYTQRIAAELGVKGLLNLQFVVHENRVYVLEVNLRSSRTVPFVSKVTGLPLVKLAVRAIMGQSLTDQGCVAGLQPRPDRVGVKLPVFSWSKLSGVDTILGPEMKSTGEVMSLAGDVPRALYKALLAGGFELSGEGSAIITLADADKKQALQAVKAVYNAGYGLYATKKTAAFLEQAGLPVQRVSKLSEEKAKAPDILEVLTNGDVALVVNTYTSGGQPERDGYQLRRAAAELGVPCVTSLDTLGMLAGVLNELAGVPLQEAHITALQDLHMPIE